MSYTHRMQASRFELKYIIDEPTARRARDFLRSYLEPDEYADPRDNNSYSVHSLYCDSRDYCLCRATMHGHMNRYKLRIRFYDEKPHTPLFFEIKRRQNDVILKQRAAVKRARVARLLAGHVPSRDDMFKPNDLDGFAALQRFYQLYTEIGAEGRAFVSYRREAYANPHDDEVRITFDRQITGGPYRGAISLAGFETWPRPPVPGVVLELKFTDRFPVWMRHLVQSLNLRRTCMAKYVACALALANRDRYLRAAVTEARVFGKARADLGLAVAAPAAPTDFRTPPGAPPAAPAAAPPKAARLPVPQIVVTAPALMPAPAGAAALAAPKAA